ncbi:heme peroxidase family protein [uncultured Tateyamaria sp.]|uniref:peroxidase family protein n=1 Tax=uncultured Tateyamaria sp. TaxID=455651 RepID=UPI0026204F6F|nr:heme peroxidase family protein [uncultured Tateyamaria sp.]
MLFVKGHGVQPVIPADRSAYGEGKAMSAASACGICRDESCEIGEQLGRFSYSFPQADGLPDDPALTDALDALASEMVDNQPPDAANSTIPPGFTYMGQFIDHDITANTDRETGLLLIDTKVVTPLDREAVQNGLGNLRFGSLNLDSLYGGGPVQGAFAKVLTKALRWPQDRAKLEAGTDSDSPFQAIPLPQDRARDLLRLGWALKSGQITAADLDQVPDELREAFFNPDGTPRLQRALIGDLRNDENLAVSQFHLAMVRLHNTIVDAAPLSLPHQDRDAVHDWARATTQWTYQWLIVNAYLPAICDPAILQEVKDRGAPLYSKFFERNRPHTSDTMPIPLEFSAAAFRFGHTMVRAEYDWSRNFGRGASALLPRATFRQLFEFTSAGMSERRLPEHWPIEWERFVFASSPDRPDRAARKIDTMLAPPLTSMDNEPAGSFGVMKNLTKRNLRRGYRLNLPTAQGCLAALATDHGISLPALTPDQIASGHTGASVQAGGFEHQTPLWFYLLKEAELLGHGECLGPLGSFLVADTLIGLLRLDPNSYINAAPGKDGWLPEHAVKPGGEIIRDMPTLMRAVGLL